MFFVIFFTLSQSIRVLEELTAPATDTIPISVGVDQMEKIIDNCETYYECTADKNANPKCGKHCFATAADHYFQYKFTGQQYQIYGSKGSGFGKIKIYLGGNLVKEVDVSTGNSVNGELLYTSDILTYGEYTIKVTGESKIQIYKFAYWPSVKAKRLNFTDMIAGGNWVSNSDGVGGILGWSNNKEAQLMYDVPCSKIWIYGSTGPNYGSIKIKVGDNDYITKTEHSETKTDGVLLYETNELPFRIYSLLIENPNEQLPTEISFYCAFYEHDPPPQTPAPYPSPSPQPLLPSDFIGKTYENSFDKGFFDIPQQSDINEFSGCTFKNVVSDGNFLGVFRKKVAFHDNVFEYDDFVLNPSIAWVTWQVSEFTIERCTFTNYRYVKQFDEGLIMSFNANLKLAINSCTFNKVGRSDAHFMFKINGQNTQLTIYDCTFYFESSEKGSRVGKIETGNVLIDHCTFTNCPRDMVKIDASYSGDIGNTVQFTNNIVQGNTRQFMILTKLRRAPVIENNVFQNINMESGYLISIMHHVQSIRLYNNTFSHVTTKAGSYCGGTSIWFQHMDKRESAITYEKCYFYDNANNNENAPFNQGGAIHYGYTTSISDTAVNLKGCEFKRNKCPNGYGGAVAFSIDQDLTISDCIFEDNSAGKYAGAIYFFGNIVKPSDNSDAPEFSGTFKLDSISITNCQFSGNNAGSGKAIYIFELEDFPLFNVKLIISGCTFTDNSQYNFLIYANIGKIEIDGNHITYADRTKSSGILIVKPKKCQYVKISNNDFTNCYTDDMYSMEINTENDDSEITIQNCKFENCYSSIYIVANYKGTINVDSCTFKFDDANNACGALSLGSKTFTLKNSNFIKTNAIGAVKFASNGVYDTLPIVIDNCMFDSCLGHNKRCFDVSTYTNNIQFKNTLIQNMPATDRNGYILSFGCNYFLETFVFENITFLNNRCSSDYGGGSGIWVTDVENIEFKNCHFIGNTALKDSTPRDKVPLGATESVYYQGDGGGFQYGFSNTIYDVNMFFDNCEFRENKAVRHGGALALQTVGTVEIRRCTFIDNIAGYDPKSSSAQLLFNNYYSYKTHGRGGAIYLNPAFSHKESDQTKYMKSVVIEDNTITTNTAYDGFALYVQGEDPGTEFSIIRNTFDKNTRQAIDVSARAVILSEIKRLTIDSSNKFVDPDVNPPKELVYANPDDGEDDGNDADTTEFINCSTNTRHEYFGADGNRLIVIVTISKFNNIHTVNKKHGGALYIVNAGLACQDVSFDNCITDQGYGGAIYLHNTFDTTSYVYINDDNFTSCSAKLGGAVFIYSSNKNCVLRITGCLFKGNIGTAPKDSTKLYGGSGMFVAGKKGRVLNNYFEENVGDGSSLKLYSDFDNAEIKSPTLQSDERLIVSKCNFVLSDNSDGGVHYTRGNGGPRILLSDCSFSGKLKKGAHYIDGELISENSPKMIVRNCKSVDAASLDDSSNSLINLNSQVFDVAERKIEKKSQAAPKKALTVVVAAISISLAAIVGFLVFAIKKKNPNDENEMSSEATDI